jgi:hypothetical protein
MKKRKLKKKEFKYINSKILKEFKNMSTICFFGSSPVKIVLFHVSLQNYIYIREVAALALRHFCTRRQGHKATQRRNNGPACTSLDSLEAREASFMRNAFCIPT